MAIAYRVDDIASQPWSIIPKKQGATIADARIDEATLRMQEIDGKQRFSVWIRKAAREVLVTDALSIYPRKTRKGEYLGFRLIDGKTIRPLADIHGNEPDPPAPAYQQVLYGKPWWEGTCDELLYRPMNVRNGSRYGRSPTEDLVLTINRALRRQSFDLSYYSDSNIPEALVPAPGDMDAEQVKTLQDWFDSIVSQPNRRRKMHFVPSLRGTIGAFQFKQPILDPAVEEFLDRRTLARFGVPPNELGFTVDVNRSTGDTQENVNERRRLALMQFISGLITDLLALFGYADLMFQFHAEKPAEDKKLQAELDEIYVRIGRDSIDDLQERDGKKRIGAGGHYIYTATGLVPVPVGLADGEALPLSPQQEAAAEALKAKAKGDDDPSNNPDDKSSTDKGEQEDDEPAQSNDRQIKRQLIDGPVDEDLVDELHRAGNEGALIKYWRDRMGSGGHAGDFDECVAALSKHSEIDDPKALCSWMHKKVTGATPGHAAAEIKRDSSDRAQNMQATEELEAWERWALKRVGKTGTVRPFRFEHLGEKARGYLVPDSTAEIRRSADIVRSLKEPTV